MNFRKPLLHLLILAFAFSYVSCDPSNYEPEEFISDDEKLAGDVVTGGLQTSPYYKLFVLNEGAMGMNNSSLDFMRFKDGKYVKNSFKQMNPTVTGGLGDIGNDMKVFLNSIWAVMNGSGMIEVFSALDETHITSIPIPSPRQLVFDESMGYAYVTSYAGATYGDDREGALYRIPISSPTPTAESPLPVGFQPEGVTVCNDYVYVACSGGFHVGYDNRIFIVDPYNWVVTGSIEGPVNMNSIITDGMGRLWVAAAGDYYSVHSGLYCVYPQKKECTQPNDDIANVRVSCMSYDAYNDKIYCLGSDDEWVWDSKQNYNLYIIDTQSMSVQKIPFSTNSDAQSMTYPYGVVHNAITGELYITDAGDWKSPGEVWCFSEDMKTTKWHHSAGIGPAHPLLYAVSYGYF